MKRLIAVLLCSGLAIAGDFVVRVTVGVDPAPDAVVTIVKKDAGIVFDSAAVRADAKTDATGQAVVRVEVGDRVLVYKPGFELAVAETTGDLVDIALRPERVFEGIVVDAQDKPLSGVNVFLRSRTNREATLRAQSDNDGRFFVYGLWFDDYGLAVEKTGYGRRQFYPSDLSTLRITMLREASLSGVVHDTENRPLAGIVLEFNGREAKAGLNGSFRFDRCSAGEQNDFELRARPPYKGAVLVKPFEDGEQRTLPPLRVEAPVTLRARVVSDDKTPLAKVIAWDPSSDRTESDAKGLITLNLVAGKRVGISLLGEGLVPQYVEVDAKGGGATVDLGDIVMRPQPRIEVQVRHPDGTLVAGGRINGTAFVKGVAMVVGEGDYAIAVEGYPLFTWPVRAPGPVSVTLPEPVWVVGRVLDFDGAPFQRIEVHSADADTTTDAEGRFRLGPNSRDGFWVEARSGDVTRTIEAPPSDTELEIRMPRDQPDLVRGRVLRRTSPVTRFGINGRSFTNEEGRFELVIDRATEFELIVNAGEGSHFVPLPPAGEDAIVRLPGGRIEVTVDGPTQVGLSLHGRRERSRLVLEGIAVFEGLEPGRYEVADFTGASKQVDLARDGTTRVQLLRRERARVTVVTGTGTYRTRLPPGRHTVVQIDPPYVALHDLDMRADDLRVDLVTAASGALVVRGGAGLEVRLERRLDRCSVVLDAKLKGGLHRFDSLRVGPYDVFCDGARRRVEVQRGRTTTVEFDDERATWSGRVQFEPGRPAAGATVRLMLDDRPFVREARTDMRGRFRFEGIVPGTYRCVVEDEDHVPVSRLVEIEDGVEVAPFVLRRPVGRVAFVGPAGTRLRLGHAVWVDGVRMVTDYLGDVRIAGATARVDLDVEGYASLRGRIVRPGEVVRLQRGASLVLRTDAAADRIQVRVGGVRFDRLEAGAGGFVLDDLPAGPAVIEIIPEGDGGEPRVERATLRPGVETRVDLGG